MSRVDLSCRQNMAKPTRSGHGATSNGDKADMKRTWNEHVVCREDGRLDNANDLRYGGKALLHSVGKPKGETCAD